MRTARRGYTLLEVVLVMAILLIVTSLIYPLAAGWFSGHKTTANADQVRARLAEARSLAQKEGRAYTFAIKENTGLWRLAPDGAEHWDSVSDEMWTKLEEGGLFSIMAEGDPALTADGMRTVTFLPNGTARTNVRLGVGGGQGQAAIILQIRAETGTVTEEVEGQ